jgi:hypothetical protein
MIAAALALATLGVSTAFHWATGRWSHPLALYFALWSACFAIIAINPFGFTPLDAESGTLFCVGLGAVVVGSILARGSRATGGASQMVGAYSYRTLFALAVVLAGVVAYGLFAERAAITAAAGTAFDSLSPSHIRFVTVYGGAGHIGLGAIAFECAPLLAGVGIAIARRSALGWIVTALALLATTLTPARMFTVTTAVIAMVFWLYLRGNDAPSRRKFRHRSVTLLAVTIAGLGSILYFVHSGDETRKNHLITAQVAQNPIPSQLTPLAVYFSAGPQALTRALVVRDNPAEGERYRSVWLLPRLMAIVDEHVHVPNTIPGFVGIPLQFNLYTWVGDVWFDFGWLGVLVVGVLLGWIVEKVHRRARARTSLTRAWTAAVVVSLFFWTIMALRFFWLETTLWIALGALVFPLVERRHHNHRR